jgi:ABC-2 type transport system permease protein
MAPTSPRAAARPKRVGFFAHLSLIATLRLWTSANHVRSAAGAAPAAIGAAWLAFTAAWLGAGGYWLMTRPAVAASPLWSSFLLRFVFFVMSAVLVTWPVLAAGVDESSELSRFATFPITSLRLFLASTLCALFEPRSLVFMPAVIGAAWGYWEQRPFPALYGASHLFAFFALNVAWSRAALTLLLNVLRHRRSAEILGSGFLSLLLLVAFAPPLPLDLSWLKQALQGAAALSTDPQLAARLAAGRAAFGQMPPGFCAAGIELAARGELAASRGLAALTLAFALVGLGLAYLLLVRFYRTAGRPPKPRRERVAPPGSARDGAFFALLDRELSDWLRNPKARLLSAVPFFLLILLRFVRAPDLARAALGGAGDAWIVAALCSYAGLVVGPNFAQNAFAYDGPGLALLFAAPVPLRRVFLAKNLVHGGGALLVALLLTALYGVYVHPIGAAVALFGLLALLAQLPVLLGVGNLLSVLAPRKFHASLRRRDRPPLVSTVVGLACAAAGLAPVIALLKRLGPSPPGPLALGALGALASLTFAGYLVSLPRTVALLEARRETVLRLITRE